MKLAVFVLLLVVLPFQASSYVCDTLIVEVIKGSGLMGDSFRDPADAYVQAEVARQRKQTHVVWNNGYPVWNKDLTFTNVKSYAMWITVYEKDYAPDSADYLTSCYEKLRLGSHVLKCGGPRSGWLWGGIHCLKGNMKRKRIIL